MSQRIFMDTEFTGFSDPGLISIGLAAESGADFYAETDYMPEECSDFVRKEVIPLLGKSVRYSLESLGPVLLDWLELVGAGGPVLICHDADVDRTLFEGILKADLPAFVLLRKLDARHVDRTRRLAYHAQNGLPVHHALHDAQALRHAFRGWVRNVR